jgi:ABC-type phosphate transport system ATPase subunit
LEQLKLQKLGLKLKLGIIFVDQNVENAIRIVDAEIEKVEGELAEAARIVERENEK